MNALRPAWQGVEARTPNTIFQRFEWNQAAARIFAESHPPFVVMAASDSGVCIIPACIDVSKRRLSLLGEELFDYRNFLRGGDEQLMADAWQPLRDFAITHQLGLGFHSLRSDVCSEQEWLGQSLLPFTAAPCALASKSAGCHHTSLEVNLRRMGRLGITVGSHGGSETALLQQIYSAKAQEPASLFHSSARVELLLAMCRAAGAACDIFTLQQGTTLVAALVTFLDSGWRRFYTTYYDRAWSKHSPGVTLLYEVIRQSLAAGLDCDLMTGEQPYKLRFADSSVPLYKIQASADDLRKAAQEATSYAA